MADIGTQRSVTRTPSEFGNRRASSEAALFILIATVVAMTSVAFIPKDLFYHFYSFIPSYVALFMLLATGQFRSPTVARDLGLTVSGISYWPAAIALGVLPMLGVWAVAAGLDWGAAENVDYYAFLAMAPSWLFTAFGEEVGWRGYLVPRLQHLGRFRMTLVSGTFWSIWHFPLYFVGFEEGGKDILVVVVMTTVSIYGLVFILNELRLRTRSIWPGVLTHGFLNIALVSYFADPEGADVRLGSLQLIAEWIGAGLLMLFFVWKGRRA